MLTARGDFRHSIFLHEIAPQAFEMIFTFFEENGL